MLEALVFSLGLTAHIGLEHDYNEVHPHVRYSNDSIIAGAYYNSEERISLYGGYRYEPTENVGVEVSLVTGYPNYIPIGPMVRVTHDIENIRTFASPTTDGDGIGIVLGVEIMLKK